MKCPVCNTIDLLMSDKKGVEIDYCPQCRGIWLDRGELDKIIERSISVSIQQVSTGHKQPYRETDYASSNIKHGKDHDDDHDSQYGKPYKKKSFLQDLFDF